MPFTPEELAEMAAADAEIEADFALTQEEYLLSRELDRNSRLENMDRKRRVVVAKRREYYQRNKEAAAAYRREYRERNKEAVAAGQRVSQAVQTAET